MDELFYEMTRKIIIAGLVAVAFVAGSMMTGTIVDAAKGGDPLAPVLTAIADLTARMTSAEEDIADHETRIVSLENSQTVPTPSIINTLQFTKSIGPVSSDQMPSGLALSTIVEANSDGVIMFQYLGFGHCGDIRVHYSIDGVPQGTTPWILGTYFAGESITSTDIIEIDSLVPGSHTLTLQPEGRTSGCITVGISFWQGTVQFYN